MDVFEFGAPPPRPPSRHAWVLPLVLLVAVAGGGAGWRLTHPAVPPPRPPAAEPGAPVLRFAAPGAALATAAPLDARTLTDAARTALLAEAGTVATEPGPDVFQAASEFWQETAGSGGRYRVEIACAGQGAVRLTVTQLAGAHTGQVYLRQAVPCAGHPGARQYRFSARPGTFGLVVQPTPGTAAMVALRQEPAPVN